MVSRLVLLFCLFLPGLGLADTPRDGVAIARVLKQIETKLREALSLSGEARQLKLQELVDKHVDLGHLTARCLDGVRGIDRPARRRIRAWLGARLLRQLQRVHPDGESVKAPAFTVSQGEQRLKGRRATVALTWSGEGQAGIPLDVELWRRKGRWRIWDLRGARINVLRRYRSHFQAQLRKGGKEALLQGMEDPAPDATTAGKKSRPLR